jgi:hypothetical protein
MQGSSNGGGGECLNELNEGVLRGVSQALRYGDAIPTVRNKEHLLRQLPVET